MEHIKNTTELIGMKVKNIKKRQKPRAHFVMEVKCERDFCKLAEFLRVSKHAVCVVTRNG